MFGPALRDQFGRSTMQRTHIHRSRAMTGSPDQPLLLGWGGMTRDDGVPRPAAVAGLRSRRSRLIPAITVLATPPASSLSTFAASPRVPLSPATSGNA